MIKLITKICVDEKYRRAVITIPAPLLDILNLDLGQCDYFVFNIRPATKYEIDWYEGTGPVFSYFKSQKTHGHKRGRL
jgi:hypothetical protein